MTGELLANVYGQPWAMADDALDGLLSVVSRADLNPDWAAEIRTARAGRPEAVAARRAERVEGARALSVRDGVGILPVVGPIVRYAGLFSDLSGATSIEAVAHDLAIAKERGLKALLLTVDSPGGTVNGVNELAEMVYDLRAVMQVEAYVGGQAASGGYWLASAAGRITVDETASLGSVGVVVGYRDTRRAEEAAGVKNWQIVSSNAPLKRPDLATEDGMASILAQIDALETVFIAKLARNRGVSADKVKADFGRGAQRIGADAVAAGMADAVGSFEAVMSRLAGGQGGGRGARPNIKGDKAKMATVSFEVADSATPAEVAAAFQAAQPEAAARIVAGAAAAERDRVFSVLDVARVAADQNVLLPLAKDGKSTAGDAALALMQADKAKGARALENIRADAPPPLPSVTADDAGAKDAEAVSKAEAGKQPVPPLSPKALAEKAQGIVAAAKADGRSITYAAAVRAAQEKHAKGE